MESRHWPDSLNPSGSGILAAACAVLLLTPVARAAGAAPAEKLQRQVQVMERIVDRALIDSPNFLVTRGENTRGLYLSGFGAVFTFDASLNAHRWDLDNIVIGSGSDLVVRDGGDIVIRKRGLRDWLTKREKETKKDPIALYEKGKTELVDLLLNYAETLSALPAGDTIVLAASLNDEDLKDERKISKLVIRASIDDLKAYAADRLSESEAKSRIQIEES